MANRKEADAWTKAFGSEVNTIEGTNAGDAVGDVGMIREGIYRVTNDGNDASTGPQPEPILSFDKPEALLETFEKSNDEPEWDLQDEQWSGKAHTRTLEELSDISRVDQLDMNGPLSLPGLQPVNAFNGLDAADTSGSDGDPALDVGLDFSP